MSEKICRLCGEDCSDRPRIKDAKGHYACKACAKEYRAKRAGLPLPELLGWKTY
ncbi:MAG: hypothetical protein AAGB34_04190 [Planctomycetota bacterium]